MIQTHDPDDAEKILFDVVVGKLNKQVRFLVERDSLLVVNDALFDRLRGLLMMMIALDTWGIFGDSKGQPASGPGRE